MDKNSWLRQLKNELNERGVTKEERDAVLNYYIEMYQDKLEDGLTEQEILIEFGFPQDVADSVLNDEKKEKSGDRAKLIDSDIFDDASETLCEDNTDDKVDDSGGDEEETPAEKNIKRNVFSLFTSIVLGVLIFLLYAAAVITVITGIGVVISSFTMISQSFGMFAIMLGIGFIVFAVAGVFEMLGRLSVKVFKKSRVKA